MKTPKSALRRNDSQPLWNTIDPAPELAVEEGWERDVDEGSEVEELIVNTAGELVAPLKGAVDCPLISLEREELKLPVMLAKVNLAENASTGYWG